MANFVVCLRQRVYQTSLGALRNYLQNLREGYLDIELKLASMETPVHMQLRCSDPYVIGLQGHDGWYHFENEDGGWGKSCGIGFSHAQNHDFRGLDQRGGGLTCLETHLASRSRSDNRRDLLFADGKNHLGHQAADPHTFNSSN
jgi:hypothetical protein